eukprot:CAMPEP_0206622070 /NCGR_PEP_ID=MMETSP0325_2-20121206/62588_1 /ASSEMBLY_ACC=CAM_ASM_000347 /TAXON_ID=2866 /ORGANISM="Crypthecodinium cohnii, Strain Seligo" /LENGTH=89 /DNA_ID=CAMNT_0054145327 /DNA_START=104 /DNA_END=370 /DNA_ORIENTATION=+
MTVRFWDWQLKQNCDVWIERENRKNREWHASACETTKVDRKIQICAMFTEVSARKIGNVEIQGSFPGTTESKTRIRNVLGPTHAHTHTH